MRSDVLAALSGTFPSRIPTRETMNHPGFVRGASGGLHGDVPMANLAAYFATRDRMGIPAEV